MEINAQSRLPVASLLWRQLPSALSQTVICKATFDLVPGEATLSEQQDPISEADRTWGDDPARSVRIPTDMVPWKPCSDVLLVGQAFAPNGQAVRKLTARLVFGDLDKAVQVTGERSFTAKGSLGEARPFTSMHLAYEHAAGGAGTWNPVGVPTPGVPDARGRVALPMVLPVDHDITSPKSGCPPIGYGPIGAKWPQRAVLVRGGGPAKRLLERPLPENFNMGFYNAAPVDQQSPQEIRGDEKLVLENLHPEIARLVTRLPSLRPWALIERPGTGPQSLRLRGDTLWIDTDRAIVTVTWRGRIPLHDVDEAGQITVGIGPAADDDPVRSSRATSSLRSSSERPGGLGSAGERAWFLAGDEATVDAATLVEERGAPLPPPRAAPRKTVRPPAQTVTSAAFAEPPKTVALPTMDPRRVEAPRPVVEAPRPMSRAREAIDLLWYDPTAVTRVRAHPAWRAIVSDLDRGAAPNQPRAEKDRRDVLGVLARGDVLALDGIRHALAASVQDDGSFVPPYVLASGLLEVQFDEHETLKATLLALAPFVALDRRLKEAVDQVAEVLRTPGIERARKVAVTLGERLRAAIPADVRGSGLDEAIESMLVDGRCYLKHEILGGRYLQGSLMLARDGSSNASAPARVFIPEEADSLLPLARRFEARLIVEARPTADPEGRAALDLRVAAVARRSPNFAT